MEGFTIKQAEAFRDNGRRSDGMDDMEKCAQASSTLMSSLIGAGLGGGLGLVADSVRPADEDENRARRRLAAILSGAVLGGVAGAGADQFRKNTPVLFPPKKRGIGALFDAIDPAPSTAVAAGGIGYWARPHLLNGGRIRELVNPDRNLLNSQPFNFGKGHEDLASALGAYDREVGSGRLRSGVNWLGKKVTGGKWKPFEEAAAARSDNIKRMAGELLAKMKADSTGKKIMETVEKAHPAQAADAETMARALSHRNAKLMRASSKAGRAGRAAALAAGLLALGYRIAR